MRHNVQNVRTTVQNRVTGTEPLRMTVPIQVVNAVPVNVYLGNLTFSD